jgi:hypothetical protein
MLMGAGVDDAVAAEAEGVAAEAKGVATEAKGVATEAKGVATEAKGVSWVDGWLGVVGVTGTAVPGLGLGAVLGVTGAPTTGPLLAGFAGGLDAIHPYVQM